MAARRATKSGGPPPAKSAVPKKSALPDQRPPADPVSPTDGDAPAIPRLPRVFIPRARLWSRLEEATRGGLTMVVAPVGAGKTLGVAGWLRSSGRGAETRWVHADATWLPERIEDVLTTAPGLVVVDDAQRLPAATLRMLDDRLVNNPESLRLLLLSRWDLPLTRLVPELMGHLSIIRGDLLRMDADECVPLIAEHARTEHPDVVDAITTRAGGWAAAVVLASRAIAAAPDAAAAARRYAEGRASVADSLASELFAALHPSERHLLLCVAHEETVSLEDAAHLSRDQRAGEILAGLEATGLLVTRLPPQVHARPLSMPGADSEATRQHDAEARYRIHPLLTEVVRRRLVAGGVDVAQAQATIRRAVRLDVSRGETEHAFARLVVTNQPQEAAQLLADEGATILMRGRGAPIASFARAHLDTLDSMPDTWFALGLERWLDNDATGAGHWLDRLVAEWLESEAANAETNESLCPRVACTRLLRALLGNEPLAAAVGHARRVVLAQMRASAPEPLLPLLLTQLGVAQGWLGDLTEAEVNLTTAAALGRARGLHRLAASALSHLALIVYMQGRENTCIDIAQEALEADDAVSPGPTTRAPAPSWRATSHGCATSRGPMPGASPPRTRHPCTSGTPWRSSGPASAKRVWRWCPARCPLPCRPSRRR